MADAALLREQAAKHHQLSLLSNSELRAHYIAAVRAAMQQLSLTRQRMFGEIDRLSAAVTANDAREAFEAMKPPPPSELSRNFLGCIFHEEGWHTDSTTIMSRVKGSHARRILCWYYTLTPRNA